ncbi:NTTRR-F1 domain, partial [Amphibacillus jilinensis]|uniref:NTTRR-F1 domain n=1 Tax=Amphibacillus jilinensis TaxID=1216008 RepID=UPI00037B65F9
MSIENLVVNGGFETSDLTGGAFLNTIVTPTQSHSGIYSARFASGTVQAFISQTVPANPGESYQFFGSFAKFTAQPSPIIQIQLQYLDAGNNVIGTGLDFIIAYDTLPIVVDDNWNEIYQTSTAAPAGTTQAQLTITKQPSAL